MYSAHNEGKSVVAERFIRTLKHKIYKYMTMSKNVYIDKLDNIIKNYNNIYITYIYIYIYIYIYYRTIKMNSVDLKSKTC